MLEIIRKFASSFGLVLAGFLLAAKFARPDTASLLLLFAAWCLLWVFSSSDMAFTECAGSYELFSSNTRQNLTFQVSITLPNP